MILAAVVACEIGFWVVLAAGLAARYALRRPQLGGVLLVCVPLVDVVLLVLTVVDLRGGGSAEPAHGLAAVYLGFSVVFGHSLVRSADARFAHRYAGGPAPAATPVSGSWARARSEWRSFGRACLAAGISAALLLAAVALVGSGADTTELANWLPRLAWALAIWLVAGPVWQTVRVRARRSGPAAPGRRPRGETATRPPARRPARGSPERW